MLLAADVVAAEDVVTADEMDAAIELGAFALVAVLLTSGLLVVALLGWLELSLAGAPPQADNKTGKAIKNTS